MWKSAKCLEIDEGDLCSTVQDPDHEIGGVERLFLAVEVVELASLVAVKHTELLVAMPSIGLLEFARS